MQSVKIFRRSLLVLSVFALAACHSDPPNGPQVSLTPTSCPGINLGIQATALTVPQSAPATLAVLGNGPDTIRYSAEIAVRGTIAYTSTWSVRRLQGNKINIWDVSGNVPTLIDSLIVVGATTTGDVAISDDGGLLVVATERIGGSIVTYDLADPRHPKLLSRFTNAETDPGVHTAEIGRVNGKLYAFLSIDPGGASLARLVIVDLSTPTAPREVFSKVTGNPYVHDTFLRDGLLFVALWDNGIEIWDVGGCGTGASPANPAVLGGVKTLVSVSIVTNDANDVLRSEAHNVVWFHDTSGSKRYVFVGEEGPGAIGSTSLGDIHVVDISDPTKPKEVAFYHVEGAGTHNFSVDEVHGVLYAAYYNGGVRAIDIRGDLGTCPSSEQKFNAAAILSRCDLRLMGRELAVGLAGLNRNVYVWGVQYLNGNVYASDMVNGIWKLGAAK